MKPVSEAFDELGVAYAVGGSVAGLAHGFSRFTMDVDIVAALQEKHVAEFSHRLRNANFFVDEEMIIDAVRHRHSFNVFDENTGFKVDVFITSGSAWDEQVLARREPGYLGDDKEPAFTVESVEDLALSKLRWFKMSGGVSDRQWNDVLGVLKLNFFDLDFDYLQRWARELKIHDLLEKALDEAGITDTNKITGMEL